jgi:CelD/BcsL family acetyltransferase involved in cellulose biosynthesis
MASPDSLHHVFYENGIPPDVERHLENIYQNPFSLARHFEIFRAAQSFKAVLIWQGAADPVHALAYAISGDEITVLNELVDIEPGQLQYAAGALFDRYPAVSTINCNRLKAPAAAPGYPVRHWRKSEDIAVELPASFEAYHGKLGKQTQKHIKYYLNRLNREQAGFEFQVAVSGQIDASVISRIIEMNRLRMEGKNIRSGYDRALEEKIGEFCGHCGLVSTIRIGEKIVAGAICYQVGSHGYLEAIAHDPEFDKYNIGQVCLYLTIKNMIEGGKSSFHMLWGEKEYKYRFLGVKQELYSLSVYRSNAARLLSLPKLVRHLLSRAAGQSDYLMNKYLRRRFR